MEAEDELYHHPEARHTHDLARSGSAPDASHSRDSAGQPALAAAETSWHPHHLQSPPASPGAATPAPARLRGVGLPTPTTPEAHGGSSPAGSTTGAADEFAASDSSSQRPIALPRRYELCEPMHIVALMATTLVEAVDTNDRAPPHPRGVTRFHSRSKPPISIPEYLARLAIHATLPPALLLWMVYYIDRVSSLNSLFTLNSLTAHRFLIAAATVAAKGLSDHPRRNTFYAYIGGVTAKELSFLESEILVLLDWRIVPGHDVLMSYYYGLVAQCSGAYVMEPAKVQ